MTRHLFTKFATIDGFLGQELSAQILDFALRNEDNFIAARVTSENKKSTINYGARKSVVFQGKLGETGKKLRQVFLERSDELFTSAGLVPLPEPMLDVSVAAHRDGGFFRNHADTLTDTQRRFTNSDRILSAVYYFNREPAVFSGGELSLLPISGDAEPVKITPRHDRLAVFPSFAPHEVLPISVPGDAFSDARFSVNCWFCRARQ